jgi:hypothetical protein
MKHDRCPCCRANYLTTVDDGNVNHQDEEEEVPPLVPGNSNNEQEQQPSPDEPMALSRYLRSVLDGRQSSRVHGSLDDSGYSRDGSEENASRSTSTRSTDDASGEISDDLESQLSERQQI